MRVSRYAHNVFPGDLGWEVSGETGILAYARTGHHPPTSDLVLSTQAVSSILLSLGSPYRAWVLSCYSCGRASAVAGQVRESISVAQTSHFRELGWLVFQ